MDKYQIELWGDTEAYGPVVELSESDLEVLERVFGNKALHLHGDYESVCLRNISEEERRREAAKKAEAERQRALQKQTEMARKKVIACSSYGSYNVFASAFAKATAGKEGRK